LVNGRKGENLGTKTGGGKKRATNQRGKAQKQKKKVLPNSGEKWASSQHIKKTKKLKEGSLI